LELKKRPAANQGALNVTVVDDLVGGRTRHARRPFFLEYIQNLIDTELHGPGLGESFAKFVEDDQIDVSHDIHRRRFGQIKTESLGDRFAKLHSLIIAIQRAVDENKEILVLTDKKSDICGFVHQPKRSGFDQNDPP